MRVLQVHNSYRQPGGEDQVCQAEYQLLTRRGHHVLQYLAHNDAIAGLSRINIGLKTIWNAESYRAMRALIAQQKPDVVHAHNTFPIISPAIYYAAAAERIPVVHTLHNYRIICPAATLFRDGRICEECLCSPIPYRAVVHRCYRNSSLASAAVTSMLAIHRLAGTWKAKIGTYIALTSFSKNKFVQAGLPADRIVVKPNCLATDPGIGQGRGGYAFFAGRITEEKGLRTLLTAWARLGSLIPLKIAGDGPLAETLKKEFGTSPDVEWLGYCEHAVVMRLLQDAAFLVFPSRYHENLPMAIVEAFACGTPVLASALGSLNELICDHRNGFHFQAGDADDLAVTVLRMLAHPGRLAEMREIARLSYEQNYTAERNYDLLMQIYTEAIQHEGAA